MPNENKQINHVAMVGDRTIPPKDARFIEIYIMGQRYKVPETLTILKAMEYVGYQFKRSCGYRFGLSNRGRTGHDFGAKSLFSTQSSRSYWHS